MSRQESGLLRAQAEQCDEARAEATRLRLELVRADRRIAELEKLLVVGFESEEDKERLIAWCCRRVLDLRNRL